MNNLGETIKRLRNESNLTQPQLAKMMGVSNGIISIWENNINEPKATYIKKLALIFGVSSDLILGLEDEGGSKTYNNYGTHNGDVKF